MLIAMKIILVLWMTFFFGYFIYSCIRMTIEEKKLARKDRGQK